MFNPYALIASSFKLGAINFGWLIIVYIEGPQLIISKYKCISSSEVANILDPGETPQCALYIVLGLLRLQKMRS